MNNASKTKSGKFDSATAILILALQVALYVTSATAIFRDVSRKAGLIYSEGPWVKYGGASVADLDGNGCPDLLLGHHTKGPGMEIYFNHCNGTFSRSPFRRYRDIHAITPIRLYASHKALHFIISLGGMNGRDPKGSLLIRVRPDASVVDITPQSGLSKLRQRGRGAVSLNLRAWKPWKLNGFADVLLPSAKVRGVKSSHVALAARPRGFLKRRYLSGDFPKNDDHYIAPVDAKSDGRMDVLALHECRIYQVVANYKLKDISKSVFPDWGLDEPLHGVSSMAEADFNNDGVWDLYLARATTGSLSWLNGNRRGGNISDILMLGTRAGKYEDVSKEARIPKSSQSRGVTVGDFNNDGYVDIFLVQYNSRDVFYMNNGDGTFHRKPASWFKRGRAVGDMATAVDYDMDGKLDLVISEGHWGDPKLGGFYRIMKNFLSDFIKDKKGIKRRRRFLLVRVGSSPSNRVSSMHAVVRVRAGKLNMMRRVGAPGVAVSVSYIELVHFGLGFAPVAKQVKVTWTDGTTLSRWNVKANSRITIGRV